MLTIFLEIAAALGVAFIIGLPIAIWLDKAKKEMDKEWSENE
jgi:hypothetical protein